MKGAVGTGMLNRRVLGFCPVNEWDGRVGRDEGGREGDWEEARG